MNFSGDVIQVDPNSIEMGKQAMQAAGNHFDQIGHDLLNKYQAATASWGGALAVNARAHIATLNNDLGKLDATLQALAKAADEYASAAFAQDIQAAAQIG